MKKLMGEQLNQREIDEILRDVDLNGDGLVDFEGVCKKESEVQREKERENNKKFKTYMHSYWSFSGKLH